MEKPHKEHTPKADAEFIKVVRDWCREHVPQIKFIAVDNLFTGVITVTERVDYKKKPGYAQSTKSFDTFAELMKHYKHGLSKPENSSADEKSSDNPRGLPGGSMRRLKVKVEGE